MKNNIELNRKINKVITSMTLSSTNKADKSLIGQEIFITPKEFDDRIPLAATDGKYIYLNEEKILLLSDDEMEFVLSHEALHNLLLHTMKDYFKGFDKKLLNISMDCQVNAILSVSNMGKAPKGVIESNQCGTVNLTFQHPKKKPFEIKIDEAHKKGVVQIYDFLYKFVPKEYVSEGSCEGYQEHKQANDELNANEQFNELRNKLMSHALRNKGTGSSGILSDILEGLTVRQINWKDELRQVIIPLIKANPTYAKYNKKKQIKDFIFKGKRKSGVDVSIAIDTSGSISDEELQHFMGELRNIYSSFPSDSVNMNIYLHTDEVYSKIQMGRRLDVTKVKTMSGGTSHVDVLLKAEKDNSKCLVCFTDGFTNYPERPMRIPKMLWMFTNEHGAKNIPEHIKGRRVNIKIGKN